MFALTREGSALPHDWTTLRLVLKDETHADVEAMIWGFRDRCGPEIARYIPIVLAASHFHDTWTAVDPEAPVPSQETIFRRDDYHCLYVCCDSRRHLHGHHIEFRSRGGSDHKSNRGTICEPDHIGIIHAGYAKPV